MNWIEREQQLLAQIRSEQGLTDLRIIKIRDQAKLIADLQLRVAALEREIEQAKASGVKPDAIPSDSGTSTMTVDQMIAELQKFPGNLHVIVSYDSDHVRVGIEPKAFVPGTRILIINTDLRWTDFHDVVDARSTVNPEVE